MTNLDLMHRHLATLYRQDTNSMLIGTNDWINHPIPRFYLGRTTEGNVWRFRHHLPDTLCAELTTLCESEPSTTSELPHHHESYKKLLAQDAPIENIWSGPAYWFPKTVKPSVPTIRIDDSNAFLLQKEMPDWLPDVPHQQPMVALINDGAAVAICSSVRITGDAHEAGVEVLEPYRKRGYASAVVAGWADAVRSRGALPMYSTASENIASQRVASGLGLKQYGVDFHIT